MMYIVGVVSIVIIYYKIPKIMYMCKMSPLTTYYKYEDC